MNANQSKLTSNFLTNKLVFIIIIFSLKVLPNKKKQNKKNNKLK